MEKKVDLTGFPVNNNPAPVNWRGKIIHVRPLLEIEEVAMLVNDVLSACYDKERDAIIPEMLDFAFRVCVISGYTDVVLPEDFRERYRFVYLTDLYETVMKRISSGQAAEMRKAAEAMIFRR